MLFSTYGSVLDINVLRNAKMRGQAHVVFKDVQTAVQAMRNLEGFDFFGKNLVRIFSNSSSNDEDMAACAGADRAQRVQYAKSKSDFISKLDGTYKMPLSGDAAAAAAGATTGLAGTALQQSVFRGGPPAAQPAATAAGVKRTRDEEEGDVSMEEDDDDDDDAMEESSEED